jgi:hypothetical protein
MGFALLNPSYEDIAANAQRAARDGDLKYLKIRDSTICSKSWPIRASGPT